TPFATDMRSQGYQVVDRPTRITRARATPKAEGTAASLPGVATAGIEGVRASRVGPALPGVGLGDDGAGEATGFSGHVLRGDGAASFQPPGDGLHEHGCHQGRDKPASGPG